MKELMHKALSAIAQRKHNESAQQGRKAAMAEPGRHREEDWGMSPEDALRIGTVSRYK
ncbi:hypothetical protein ACFQGA_09215 [Marinobacter koreensis]|uniref:Uncharacterized protein n=1 Tax=Marinobacter koreensis TaxID=335974 RepID=A0ABW0RHR2_9GAMM|nr:hypothetical protein [Marinobacter koreensis]MCK7547125.1 hypothetical protein [Marinobacter koreensis]MDX1816182.1 hypothetical protein [Marinobacter sp.]